MRASILVTLLALSTPTITDAAVMPGREIAIPLPVPAPYKEAQTNPNPFPPQPATPQPAPTTTPPVVVQPPQVTVQGGRSEFFDWVLSSIMALIAGIFGIKTVGEFRKPKIGDLLSSPEVRARIDERALQLIETGIPGRLVSQVPGVGIAEPLIRRIVTEILEKRLDEHRSASGAPPRTETGEDQEARLIERILSTLESRVKERLGQGTS